MQAWESVKANKGSCGIDDESIDKFESDIKNNLYKLWNRMSSGSYFPCSLTYPVLLDGESKNWKAWSNTMWPTVYLVDRKGFLRRWWQGELNWKETPGEQQMRETIEQLLSEK